MHNISLLLLLMLMTPSLNAAKFHFQGNFICNETEFYYSLRLQDTDPMEDIVKYAEYGVHSKQPHYFEVDVVLSEDEDLYEKKNCELEFIIEHDCSWNQTFRETTHVLGTFPIDESEYNILNVEIDLMDPVKNSYDPRYGRI